MALCFTIKASEIKPQEVVKNKGRVLTKRTSPLFSITIFFRSVSSPSSAYLFFRVQLSVIIYFVPDEDRCQDIIAIFVWYLFCIDDLFSSVEYIFLILFYWFFSPADNLFHCNRVYCIHVPGHDPITFSFRSFSFLIRWGFYGPII